MFVPLTNLWVYSSKEGVYKRVISLQGGTLAASNITW